MSLTEVAIRAAKPQPKPYKVYDEKGMFLLVKPNGARLWRFRYAHDGVGDLGARSASSHVSSVARYGPSLGRG